MATITIPPSPAQIGIQIGLGLGKSEAAIRAAVAMAATGQRIALVVPIHALAEDLLRRIEAIAPGIAAVYRGLSRPDPAPPAGAPAGTLMCRASEAAEAWQSAGWPIRSLCRVCPHARNGHSGGPSCGWRRQARLRPQISILPAPMLSQAPPWGSAGRGLDGLVIDESPWEYLIRGIGPDDDQSIDTAHMLQPRFPRNAVAENALRVLGYALAAHPDGVAPVSRDLLLAAGVSSWLAQRLQIEEWSLKIPVDRDLAPIVLTMDARDARRELGSVMRHNSIVARRRRVWWIIERILTGEVGDGTRALELSGVGAARALRLRWRAPIHEGWDVPTLVLDGTLEESWTRAWLPHITIDPLVTVDPPAQPVCRMRQVTWSASESALLGRSAEDRATARANRGRIARILEVRIHQHGSALLIAQQRVIDALRGDDPAGPLVRHEQRGALLFAHFGALRGVDLYRDLPYAMVLGRRLPAPADVELQAEIVSGQRVAKIPAGEWYPKERALISLRDGVRAALVLTERHPDQQAEAARRVACDHEVTQAIGRLRAVRRTPATPVLIEIVSRVAGDWSIDEARTWRAYLDEVAPRDLALARASARGATWAEKDRPMTSREIAELVPEWLPDAKSVTDWYLDRGRPL